MLGPMARLALSALLALLGCAVDEAQLVARVAQDNESARTRAERAFFERGNRPLLPPPPVGRLTLRGIDRACAQPKDPPARETVEVVLGEARGTTRFEAACALVTGRAHTLVVRLAGAETDTFLTPVPEGSAFAVAPSGAIVRYLLAPQVRETRRVFAKGVGCCCDAPKVPGPDVTFTVVVGPYPATEEVVIPFDTVTLSFCDPAAPQ